MDLQALNVTPKSGDEYFHQSGKQLPITILDFWTWSSSDLLSNATRGILAEFIVASDLGIANSVRREWDAFDLATVDGIKIEVKTSAYIQRWHQARLSDIRFSIGPTRAWDYNTNIWVDKPLRQSDCYVFALLHHKDQRTINPMNLDQWTFYVLRSKVLDDKVGMQKTIGLSRLHSLEPEICRYGEIREAIDQTA